MYVISSFTRFTVAHKTQLSAAVTAFPSSAIAQVVAPQTTNTPTPSSVLSTSTAGTSPSAASTPNGALKAQVPATVLTVVAALVYSLA